MTMQTSRSSASLTSPVAWSWRGALDASTRRAATVAGCAAVVAIACALDARVPLATGLVLAALLPAALVDVIERRLPNRMIGSAAVIGVVAITIERLVVGVDIGVSGAALGALAMSGPLLAMHLAVPASIGFGDVKLAAVAGAALGLVDPVAGLVALAIGSGLAAVMGVAGRRRTVAFGPGLLAGAIATLVLLATPLDPIERRSAADHDPDTSPAATASYRVIR